MYLKTSTLNWHQDIQLLNKFYHHLEDKVQVTHVIGLFLGIENPSKEGKNLHFKPWARLIWGIYEPLQSYIFFVLESCMELSLDEAI